MIPQQAQHGLWLAYLSFTPPSLLWLTSQISPMYVERALLASHAIFCIWLAWAYTRQNCRVPFNSLPLCSFCYQQGSGFYQHVTYKRFPYATARCHKSKHCKTDWTRRCDHSLKQAHSYLPSFYFDRDLPQSYLLDPVGAFHRHPIIRHKQNSCI